MPAEEQSAQRREQIEEAAKGIDQLHQHQKKIAEELAEARQEVQDIQAENIHDAEVARQIAEELKQQVRPEDYA